MPMMPPEFTTGYVGGAALVVVLVVVGAAAKATVALDEFLDALGKLVRPKDRGEGIDTADEVALLAGVVGITDVHWLVERQAHVGGGHVVAPGQVEEVQHRREAP